MLLHFKNDILSENHKNTIYKKYTLHKNDSCIIDCYLLRDIHAKNFIFNLGYFSIILDYIVMFNGNDDGHVLIDQSSHSLNVNVEIKKHIYIIRDVNVLIANNW